MFGFLKGLFSSSKGVGHRSRGPRGKIEKVNAWKTGKKARGKWLPHDQYVKRKRGGR